jgi:hypothetical protein
VLFSSKKNECEASKIQVQESNIPQEVEGKKSEQPKEHV